MGFYINMVNPFMSRLANLPLFFILFPQVLFLDPWFLIPLKQWWASYV